MDDFAQLRAAMAAAMCDSDEAARLRDHMRSLLRSDAALSVANIDRSGLERQRPEAMG